MRKLGTILASAFFVVGSGIMYMGDKKLEKQKQEIANIDSVRYKNACKKVEDMTIIPSCIEDYNYNRSNRVNFWRKEYKAVKDSVAALNSESAKKAYSKGIKVASDSAKTIIKSVK